MATDKERLDFITEWVDKKKGVFILSPDRLPAIGGLWKRTGFFDAGSVRKSIDAAMRAEKKRRKEK